MGKETRNIRSTRPPSIRFNDEMSEFNCFSLQAIDHTDPTTDQALIPAVAQTLTRPLVEPVYSMETAYGILDSTKEPAQGRGWDLGGSENLRAELEL